MKDAEKHTKRLLYVMLGLVMFALFTAVTNTMVLCLYWFQHCQVV